ncbi:MAG: site-2 protease family protein [Acidobacteria bacterium]|nr:site-2 protease family protein [Acidobacteriota bacterium]
MPDILLVVLAVIFVLGIAINIHELGHFIVAKLFGMRVEAYSFFGLGPRIWGFKVGHTDYRISAIPLGAYVKLYGDEATAPLEGGSSDENAGAFLEHRNIREIDEENRGNGQRQWRGRPSRYTTGRSNCFI